MQDAASGEGSQRGAASGPTVFVLDPLHPDPDDISAAAKTLQEGRLVSFPTETVYGLGAAISRPEAVARIFRVKDRPSTDPLIVHVADFEAVGAVVAEVPSRARALAEAFWPGPLTLVLPRGDGVGDAVTAGGPSVAVRVPAHPVAEALLRSTGIGVAAPSANRFGRISPTDGAHVVDDLGPHLGAGDLVLDAGPTPLGIESTVLDLGGDRPTVLRHGGVPVEDLVEVLGPVDAPERRVVDDQVAASAPGSLLRHYSPRRPLVLVEGDDALADELRTLLAERDVRAVVVELPHRADRAAAVLYGRLRAADRTGADLLLVVARDPEGLGRGINDRLYRAAHGRVVMDATQGSLDRLAASARG